MAVQLTAVFRKVPEGYIGFVEELPGANTQGATLEEARANLREAAALVLQANRELALDLRQPARAQDVGRARQSEINEDLARKICADLEVPRL